MLINYYFNNKDLRWNSLGLVGGRAFAEMLVNNKSIVNIEISGNDISDDIMRTISKIHGRLNFLYIIQVFIQIIDINIFYINI